eukprot:4678332-Prymnesium_polylepis.1
MRRALYFVLSFLAASRPQLGSALAFISLHSTLSVICVDRWRCSRVESEGAVYRTIASQRRCSRLHPSDHARA